MQLKYVGKFWDRAASCPLNKGYYCIYFEKFISVTK